MITDTRWYWAAGLAALLLMIYLLQPILPPFLIGILLAYLGDPAVGRLEARGVPRMAGVVLVFAGVIAVFAVLLLILIPLLINEIGILRDRIPAMVAWFNQSALPWVEARLGVDVSSFRLETVTDTIRENLGKTGGVVGIILQQATRSTMALLTWLVNLAMIPVVAFYLMRDWKEIMQRIRGLLPRQHEDLAVGLVKDCDEVLSSFIRGQLLVMLCLGVIYAIGLWMVGLDQNQKEHDRGNAKTFYNPEVYGDYRDKYPELVVGSGGGESPSLTIEALAIRAADLPSSTAWENGTTAG